MYTLPYLILLRTYDIRINVIGFSERIGEFIQISFIYLILIVTFFPFSEVLMVNWFRIYIYEYINYVI